jgi:hypothetical protein
MPRCRQIHHRHRSRKKKHQAAIIDPAGLQLGKSFAFDVTHEGYTHTFWQKVIHLK